VKLLLFFSLICLFLPPDGESSKRKPAGFISTLSAHDLCNEPAETICKLFEHSDLDTVLADFKNQVAKMPDGSDALDSQFQKVQDAQDQINKANNDLSLASSTSGMSNYLDSMKPLNLNAASEQQKQFALIAKIEKNTLAKFNVNQADLVHLFEQIQKSLSNHVLATAEFSGRQNADHISPSQADIVDRIKNVKLVTAGTLAARPLPTDLIEAHEEIEENNYYFNSCGPDGMQMNAYYREKNKTLNICPGFLIMALNESEGKLQSIAMVLGHELGHSIDPDSIQAIGDLKRLAKQFPHSVANYDLRDRYTKFFACVKKQYVIPDIEHFGNLKKMISQFESKRVPGEKTKGLLGLEDEIAVQEAMDPPNLNLITKLKNSLFTGRNALAQYQVRLEDLEDARQDPDDASIVEAKEMAADYLSTFALADQLGNIPDPDRALLAADSFRLYCGSPNSDYVNRIKFGDLHDPIHPPDVFRFEMPFRNKRIRELLGCMPLKPERPWCDVNP
jgi:hypothetical protein